jgi:hypothetical protein
MDQPVRGNHPIDVRIVKDPAGRPAVLLQLPNGYVTMHDPGPIRQLAGVLIEQSDVLEEIIRGDA